MKKILSLVVIALLVAGVAYADSNYQGSRIGSLNLTSRTVVNHTTYGHTHITTSPTSVYRVSFVSSSSNSYVQLLDSPGTGGYSTLGAEISALGAAAVEGGNQFIKADIGEATANEQKVVTYDPPLRFDNGVLVGFGSATGTISSGQITVEYRQD